MFQRSGSGFLGSALTTAAGVAGGLVAGNALMNMFSPHTGLGGLAAPAAPAVADSPWATPAAASPAEGAVDQGAWGSPDPAAAPDPGYVDNGSWDTSGGGDASWTDPAGGDGGDHGAFNDGVGIVTRSDRAKDIGSDRGDNSGFGRGPIQDNRETRRLV